MGATVGICLVALVLASPTLLAADDEYVVFTWGKQFRVVDHRVDFEGGRLKLVLGDESSVDIPLDSVSKILNADREVVLDLTLGGATLDPWDPPDVSRGSHVEGWSDEEVWDSWAGNPRWAFRWTNAKTAWMLVSRPPGVADAIEIRLLPISYATRILGGVPVPEIQFLRVSLNGQLLGDLALSDHGWGTYRLALPEGCEGDPGLLKLESSYLASPAEFANGLSTDSRELGVAVDYLRFVPSESERSPQDLAK